MQGSTRENIFNYVNEKYGTVPEYLWYKLPDYAVLRRADNKKWYAVIMNIPRNRLGLDGGGRVDILDIKCDPFMRDMLLAQKGFLPAYHLNRENWITVLLDGSVAADTVFCLLDESYEIAKGRTKKKVRREKASWLVPVNPKYYDIEKAFAESDTILWKQSNSVIAGDTIYLYLAAPYSCVAYKCAAVEANIPYEYADKNIRIKKAMKIKRLFTFDKGSFDLAELKEHGVVTVRGPRSVPYGLCCRLEKASGSET
ncbi:MAG: MmcQ/YjbR family DNA-binding protein [Bacteroides sp.]|nr:MmcQ/YjbR family DNA-binding protein [Prevotella sp.]MCM1407806.1 MmcQ/YjbR family DNA-binding protein [Treponema brennaborense]MCM1468846.1 MmcQ/YjbR family DNA-binding protein [Bacteroides sp.]